MDSGHVAGCAGIAAALAVLQQLLFVTALRRFVVEERQKRAETAAQVLHRLEDYLLQDSPMRKPSTACLHKLHKTSACKLSAPSSLTDKKKNHAASQRPRASTSTGDERSPMASHKQRCIIGIKTPHARDETHLAKLTSGRAQHAGSLPRSSIAEAKANDRFSTSRGAPPCHHVTTHIRPAHATQHRQWETSAGPGRPKISVSSGNRFYGNVVEGKVRAKR